MTEKSRLIEYARGSDLKDDPLVIHLANALEVSEKQLAEAIELLRSVAGQKASRFLAKIEHQKDKEVSDER